MWWNSAERWHGSTLKEAINDDDTASRGSH